jgi:hypothetical protein
MKWPIGAALAAVLALGGCDAYWALTHCRGLDMACRFHVGLDPPDPCPGQRVAIRGGGVGPGVPVRLALEVGRRDGAEGPLTILVTRDLGTLVSDGDAVFTGAFTLPTAAEAPGANRATLTLTAEASGTTSKMTRNIVLRAACP